MKHLLIAKQEELIKEPIFIFGSPPFYFKKIFVAGVVKKVLDKKQLLLGKDFPTHFLPFSPF